MAFSKVVQQVLSLLFCMCVVLEAITEKGTPEVGSQSSLLTKVLNTLYWFMFYCYYDEQV